MNERKFLIRNAKKARDLINGKLIIKPKDKSGDLVTNFDEKLENFFIKKIKKAYPDFDIVSEEANSKQSLTKNCFVIDPIDGTNNFARKIPMWGIQVACIKNGETVASVIYLPVYDELYSADKTGAYLNDDKITVNRQNERIGVYTIGGSIAQEYEMQTKNPNFRHFGSAAFSLAMVACGKTSACFFRENINPWDFIPGEFLVKMAGGFSFMKDHIRVCANMQSWSNLLSKADTFIEKTQKTEQVASNQQQKITILQESKKPTEEKIKQSSIKKQESIQQPVRATMPTLKTSQEAKERALQLHNMSMQNTEKHISIASNSEKQTAKKIKQIPEMPTFFMEESETIIETFKVEIPEPIEPKPLTVDEVLVDGKTETTNIKTPIKNIQKTIPKPIRPTLAPTTKRISLAEAKKRKIIM